MKLLLPLFLAFFLVSTVTAQIGVGFRAGILSSNVIVNDDDSSAKIANKESVTGYTFGIPIEIAVSKIFSIQPEVNFQQRGTDKTNRFDITGLGGSTSVQQDIRREINYLEIPLLFKLGYTTEKFTAAAVAGPTFSYALSGTTIAGNQVTTAGGVTVTETAGEYDIDFDREGLKRADFGAHIGIQGGIPAGPGKIILDARYQVGFTNLNDGNNENNTNIEDYESKAQGYSLTAGYMLTFGNY